MPTKIIDAETKRLLTLYEDVEQEITGKLNQALLKGNDLHYLQGMRKSVQESIKELKKGNKEWSRQTIPRVYTEGMTAAEIMIKDSGLAVKGGFGGLHKEAIQVLAENTDQILDNITNVIGRQTQDIYRNLALERVRGTVVGYDTWQEVARNYRIRLAEQGITGFTDRAGRKWNMKSYAQMVARTTTMEAHLQGTNNRLLEQGHDLIKISSHNSSCPLCSPWQGRILSLSGKSKKHPSLAEARDAGLFHPNCRHAYGLYIDLDEEIKKTERSIKGMQKRRDAKKEQSGGNKKTIIPKLQIPKKKKIQDKQRAMQLANNDTARLTTVRTLGEEGQSVQLLQAVEYDTAKQAMTLDRMTGLAEQIPEVLLKDVRRIKILDVPNERDAYWAKRYNMPGFKSFATGGMSGEITFYGVGTQAYSDTKYLHTLYHESAHCFDGTRGYDLTRKIIADGKPEWVHICEKDALINQQYRYVSSYARSSNAPAEDFADSVATYFQNPSSFEQAYPNRTKKIKELFALKD